jgi:hypothetical protein
LLVFELRSPLTKELKVKGLAALTAGLVLGVAAAAAAAPTSAITVTPHAVTFDSKFTIAFVTPAAAPTRAYDVRLRAVDTGTATAPCQARLDFYNPRAVVGHSHVSFAYVPRVADGLCRGAWHVSVTRDGTTVLTGGRFTLE